MLSDWVDISYLDVAVFVSGVVSMGLEILAGRVVAPRFGSTIYTWGGIIGISLLALSLGYHRGGRRASHATRSSLDRFLAYASLYIVALTALSGFFLDLSAALPLPPRYAALLPVAVLFGPPMYALGFISPFSAELSGRGVVGEASGHVYAVGTIGSLVGAFGTTFFLIPWLSVTSLYILFAVIAALPLARSYRWVQSYLPFAVFLIGLALASISFTAPGESVYEGSTAYQDVVVSDRSGVRTLYLDGQPQSAMYLDNRSGYPWTYPRYFHLPLLLKEDVSKVLFIGGGGFSGPKRFASMNITSHVVELDPGVVNVARTYFDVSESEHLKIFTGDGRSYVASTNQTYDVVFLDAYRKNRVPFHLTTQEFMKEVHSVLDDDGVVFSNTISVAQGPGSAFGRAQYKTVQSVFSDALYIPTSSTSLSQNIAILGVKEDSVSWPSLIRIDNNVLDVEAARNRSFRPETSDVPLLTDGYAPVDSLLDEQLSTRYVLATDES